MSYRAPVTDFRFILDHVVGFDRVAATARFAEATPDMVDAVLTEAARLCEERLTPVNRIGDTVGTQLENGVMRSPEGFAGAYGALATGGWLAVAADPEFGGMGLPQTMGTCLNDMMSSACLALQISVLLTQGQIEALEHHASDEIKALYLPKLISGEWSGTMNLSEPQAGSDVGALTTKATPNADGTYAISGQKIWISWGDSDLGQNVCHLVLARLPDAPEGVKGISLFLVPKILPNADGSLGARNDLRVVSIEEKLGLHGSPTCVMEYSGATGWMVGAPGGGMAAMFTMMNNARLGVGVQGVGIAEAAYQHALAHALERKQGPTAVPEGTGAIVDHPDVRRMLATMKADTFAARSICTACAVAIDMATATGDAGWAARAALLTPIAKGFGTEVGIDVADTGIQVFGGMGYVEETGAAQYARDVRVTAIYEGTNGIQAMDLVGRKLSDGGEAAFALLDEIEAEAEAARADHTDLAERVWQAAESLREATEWLVAQADITQRNAVSVPYLMAFGRVLGAHYHLVAARSGDGARGRLAAFYIRRLLPEHAGLLAHVTEGAGDLMALSPADLGA